MSVRFLKLFIACSLLVNVLLLGVAFGHMGRSILEQETQQRHRVNVHALVLVLSPEEHREIAQPLAKFDHNDKQLADRLTEERKKLISLLAAKPFDKEAYAAQAKVLDNIHTQSSKNMADIITAIAAVCTDGERAQLSEKMAAMLLDKK